jgi:hypothetical protein
MKLRSGFEKKVALYLEDKGVEFEYEADRLPYIVPESKHNYIPDFKLSNGIYVEAKGVFNAIQRKKLVCILDSNPDKDIRILLMRDNYINKGSKTKYSTWCEKRGIKYHVSAAGHIPQEWYDDAS